MTLGRYYRILQWRLKRRFAHFEARVADLLYGRDRARGSMRLLAWLLRAFEGLFRLMVRLRLRLYQARILKQQYLGCLVVVIGNITVGGTGKTPVVEKFARSLIAQGRKVAILSRGYKRRENSLLKKIFSLFDTEAYQPIVVSDGSGKIRTDWKRAGDEPYMLATAVPEAVVIVDKNRVKAGSFAIRKFGVDTIILDDGFQYYPLKSRLQVVLVDQKNPFGNGSLLPRGILREPKKALGRANYIFVTKSDGKPPQKLLETLREYAPHCKPILCAHAPKKLVKIDDAAELPLTTLQGAKVVAFSGIATPETFERQLTNLGAEIVKRHRFTDHYAYEPEDIEQVLKTSKDATMIVTTQKDAVRLPRMESEVPVCYLRMEIEILDGVANFNEAVQKICFPKDGDGGHTRPMV